MRKPVGSCKKGSGITPLYKPAHPIIYKPKLAFLICILPWVLELT